MNVFQLNLIPRLVLASSVLVAVQLLYWLALWFYPDGAGFIGYLWYIWVPPFYDVAFAVLVLAPFITASRGRLLRVLALVIVTAVVYLAAAYTVVNTQSALDGWIDSPYLRFATMAPTAVVATWLLAYATAWIGRLRISRRYWVYTGLAGLVTGLTFLTGESIQMYTGQYKYSEWVDLKTYWLWPVCTCVAIYYGREK